MFVKDEYHTYVLLERHWFIWSYLKVGQVLTRRWSSISVPYTFAVGGVPNLGALYCRCRRVLSKAQLAGVQNPDPLVQTGLRIITPSGSSLNPCHRACLHGLPPWATFMSYLHQCGTCRRPHAAMSSEAPNRNRVRGRIRDGGRIRITSMA